MDFKDYYRILGVARDAKKDDIQRAYRKLARKFHPDISKEPDAETRFKEINEAYEVLKDPDKRSKYDQFGKDWKRAEQAGTPPPGWETFHFGGPGGGGFEDLGGSGFSSFFEMLFGKGARGGAGGFSGFQGFGGAPHSPPQARGADHEARIQLSLEEAARGGERSLTLSDPVGGGRHTLRVRIPPGVLPGRKIRIPGKGGAGGTGGPPGDLYLTVELAPHASLRIEGQDLYTTLPVAPWEAALGTEIAVQTLEGPVTIKVPAGTSSGQKIRLRGHGFPVAGSQPGNLFAEVKIVVPKRLTSREKELFEELAKTSHFSPR